MYPSTPTPISDSFWDSFEQPNVAPATMNVDMPDTPISVGGGQGDDGLGGFGGLAQMGGQVAGRWLGNKHAQANAVENAPWQGPPGTEPGSIPQGGSHMMDPGFGPVSKQSVLGKFFAPTHAITPPTHTPLAAPSVAAAAPAAAPAAAEAAPALASAAPAAATMGASSMLPAVGPALSLAQGKKGAAMGGALGLGAGVLLAPFTAGLSIPIGAALGGMVGGMGDKKK